MHPHPTPLTSHHATALRGEFIVPGDKSISHRALMFAGMALGKTHIHGLLEGADVLATARALRVLGVESGRGGDGVWWVQGVGVGGLHEPAAVLDLGNSGTATRLLMGLVAAYDFTSFFTGDASLCSRPMARVMQPLAKMGVNFHSRSGGRLPLAVLGTAAGFPIRYRLPVASAQVKSAILLCGLHSAGITSVIEPHPTRDHTETLLRHFGARITSEKNGDGETMVQIHGQPELHAKDVVVPADPSSAAFPVAAALLVEGSALTLKNICLNPLRAGFYTCLEEMGADIVFSNARVTAGEAVADITITHSRLRGITVPAARAASMIDEYPMLAVLAAFASGTTVMEGLGELRVKESDRLLMIAQGLAACGAKVTVEGDKLTVVGTGQPLPGGNAVATAMDHRIAMSFLVAGCASRNPIQIDDGGFINTSFPDFVAKLNQAGGNITAAA